MRSDMYKVVRIAVSSWKQDSIVTTIKSYDDILNAIKIGTRIDEWQLNATVHFNAWAHFAKAGLGLVVEACQALTRLFACETCRGVFYMSPGRGEEALRCDCGAININLIRKPFAGTQLSAYLCTTYG